MLGEVAQASCPHSLVVACSGGVAVREWMHRCSERVTSHSIRNDDAHRISIFIMHIVCPRYLPLYFSLLLMFLGGFQLWNPTQWTTPTFAATVLSYNVVTVNGKYDAYDRVSESVDDRWHGCKISSCFLFVSYIKLHSVTFVLVLLTQRKRLDIKDSRKNYRGVFLLIHARCITTLVPVW